ncbi:peptidase inhibitor family I36 protein [Streptomyces beigongshangae]|uniref:peptidase inhibitor family I36 protein n=1 Tax=Streptomyces beigongshangae TaxID=2841597 RepID=UPI001C861CCE|nr:peptidase inhibitor family I36 protein [Streptomyces sp. REN17]
MRRIQSAVLAVTALAAAVLTGPAATAAPAASGNRAAYNNCPSGYFCIYSDWNGGGTRCQWSQANKANTADDCSFIQRGQNVRSVWNKTGHRVQYYTQTNYNSRVGSTPAGNGGNLQGNYQIRSFRPQ